MVSNRPTAEVKDVVFCNKKWFYLSSFLLYGTISKIICNIVCPPDIYPGIAINITANERNVYCDTGRAGRID